MCRGNTTPQECRVVVRWPVSAALGLLLEVVRAALKSTVKGQLFKNSGFSDALQRLSKAAASAS